MENTVQQKEKRETYNWQETPYFFGVFFNLARLNVMAITNHL